MLIRLARFGFASGAAVLSLGCASASSTRQASVPATPGETTRARSGRILPPASGTALAFCASPGLNVDLRLDSLVAADSPLAMGTAEIDAGKSNAGTHNDTDEITYFLSAGGRAFVAGDTVPIESGLMLWVPRGVPHGFISAPDRAIRFVWVTYPQGLAQRFRRGGVARGRGCPPPDGPHRTGG
jgi:mannose-6-phosphate isomerase-like protein (cupin superfamily)